MSAHMFSLINLDSFIIICPLLFIAGFIDAIAGGGALISIPAYLIAGIPVHAAIATNKLSASFGATASAVRFLKNRIINFKLGLPSVAFAIVGSTLGANLSMHIDEAVLTRVMFIILPVAAFVVLNKKIFHDNPNAEIAVDRRTFIITMLVAFGIGVYDGFFGPGAGTFTIICFTVFGRMSIRNANAQTKLINLTTTITALFVFMMNGQVIVLLGLAGGICNMAGSWLGAGLAVDKGSSYTRPAMLFVLVLLAVKVSGIY